MGRKIKNLSVVLLIFFIINSFGFCDNVDIVLLNKERNNCYNKKDSVKCFRNLISMNANINPFYINYLHLDTAKALSNNRRYQEALQECEYVLSQEKKNKKLIEAAREEKDNLEKIIYNMEVSPRFDFGDYYDPYNSSRWINPNNIKVYIENNYGKGYIFQKAFKIWQDSLDGLITFNFVQNEQDADIVCRIVNNVGTQIMGRTEYGVLRVFNDKTYFKKVNINLSFSNGVDNTDEFLLSTSMHEIGHALGIRYHSDSKNDVMYEEVHSFRFDNLSQRDINTVKRIYEEN